MLSSWVEQVRSAWRSPKTCSRRDGQYRWVRGAGGIGLAQLADHRVRYVALVNIEIERNIQVVVNMVHDAVAESLGELKPKLEALLHERGVIPEDLVTPPPLLRRHH